MESILKILTLQQTFNEIKLNLSNLNLLLKKIILLLAVNNDSLDRKY